MKRILILTAILIFACSSDDSSDTNDNNNNSEPIIGVWNFYLLEYLDQDTNTWVSQTDVENGGTYSQTFYENGELLFDFDNGSETYTGVWENLGNNIYRIETNKGYIDGVLFEEEVDVSNDRILFYCDDNIMRWDFGYDDYPENDQQYMSKGSYNPQDCNEAPYNVN